MKILLKPKDSDKMKDGNILVAIETNPEYTLATLRASAIVTDKGGMLSHQAIVARELGKPCVMGIEKATKVFENSDQIEVDAERGIVRKL